ncbi:MAG: sigma 54-interacting transcriptional regulator [Clostridiaceae bacterium]
MPGISDKIKTNFPIKESSTLYDNDYTFYFNNIDKVKDAKDHFIKTSEVMDCVRPEIADSWKRCISYGIDPYSDFKAKFINKKDFEKLYVDNKFLINISSSIIQSVCKALNQISFVMLLTDSFGNTLYMSDNSSYEDGFGISSLAVGARWYEEYVGTNSVSLALRHKKGMTTNDAEHFFVKHEKASCCTELIRDGYDKIIGTITITYYRNTYNSLGTHKLITGMVKSIADLIEQQYVSGRNTDIINSSFENITDGVLILDYNFNAIFANNSFLRIINASTEDLQSLNIQKVFKDINFNTLLSNRSEQHFVINESMLSFKGKSVRVNMHVYTTYQINKIDGIIILIRDIQDIIKFSQKYTEKSPQFTFDQILTQDENMLNIIHNAKQFSALDCPVLIEGPSGTGKELFAQSIHNASPRRNGPFIALNCAALPMELVESELFGYEKGTFTGALSTGKAGKFELADGGTIFLDELGELPLDIQSKLLRVLDSYKITRIGGKAEKSLNIRIIAATNRNLQKQIQNKNFREDLYYRLNVMSLMLPPLAERKSDIQLLAQHFIDKMNMKTAGKCICIDNEAMSLLKAHDWPGNIRELENTIYRAFYLCEDSLITRKHLPANIQKCVSENITSESIPIDTRANIERMLMVQALKQSNGKVTIAAKSTGIPKTTFYRKINVYDIKPTEYM